MTSRRTAWPWFALALVGALGCGGQPTMAEPIDNAEWNFQTDTPPGWTTEALRPSWQKDGVRASAIRRLEKLDNGEPAKGEGARMQVSVVEAPKGKTLAELAADPEQRAFLMNAFGKADAWPPVEVEETTVPVVDGSERQLPALRLVTKGTSFNLAETDASPCRGMMLVALADERLYRLKLLAWHTPDDAEGLRSDLDSIEINFAFKTLKKEKPKPPGGNGGEPKKDEPPKPEGDSEEEKVIDQYFVVEGWKAKKPKKLASEAIDKEKEPDLRIAFRNNDQFGGCSVRLYVYANEGFDAMGNRLGQQDLRKLLTTSWWQHIVSTFAVGKLVTFPWPKRRGGDFLALPSFAPGDEKVVFAEPKERPKLEDVDIDAVLRMKGPWVEEVTKPPPAFGKIKCRDVYRGTIRGAAKTLGQLTWVRFGWRTPLNTFILYIQFEREGLMKFEAPVKEFLDSLEVTK